MNGFGKSDLRPRRRWLAFASLAALLITPSAFSACGSQESPEGPVDGGKPASEGASDAGGQDALGQDGAVCTNPRSNNDSHAVDPSIPNPTFLNIHAFDVSHSNANILWATAVPMTERLMWDTVSHPGTTGYAYPLPGGYVHNVFEGVNDLLTLHYLFITGAPASTSIYFRVCGTATADGGLFFGGDETCSPEQVVETADYSPCGNPAPPDPPATVDVSVPTYKATVTVASDCSDLVAKFQAAEDYTQLLIPVGAQCGGSYIFPTSSKHIAIRTAGDITQLPSGTRVSPTSSSLMPTIAQDIYAHGGTGGPTGCSFGAFAWDTTQTAAWKMQYCAESPVPGTITAIGTDGGGNFNGVFTIADHGLVVGDSVHAAGNTAADFGAGNYANGSGFVTQVIDSDNVQVAMSHGYYSPPTTYTAGGTLAKGAWTNVPYTPTAGMPTGACNVGDWAFDSSVSSFDGTYRCLSANTWSHWRVAAGQEQGTFDFATNQVTNVRLMGLSFQEQGRPSDPLDGRVLNIPPTGQGAWELPIVAIGLGSSVILDRCLYTSPTNVRGGYFLSSNGDNVAVVDSYIQSLSDLGWSSAEDRSPAGNDYVSVPINVNSGGPVLFQNDYIEGYGVSVFLQDGYNNFRSVHDVTVTNNYFYRAPQYCWGSPAVGHAAPPVDSGAYYPLRELLEFKSGIRVSVDGNVFENNVRNVTSNGGAVFVWGPNNGSGAYVSLVPNGDVAPYDASVPSGEGFAFGPFPYDVEAGQWVQIGSDMYHVASALAPSTILGQPDNDFAVDNPPSSDVDLVHFQLLDNPNGGTRDVSLTNNLFEYMPVGIQINGHVGGQVAGGAAARPIRIRNNLFVGLGDDGFRSPPGSWLYPLGGGPAGGSAIWIAAGTEDVVIDHNTTYEMTGGSSLVQTNAYNFDPGTYNTFVLNDALQLTNNIATIANTPGEKGAVYWFAYYDEVEAGSLYFDGDQVLHQVFAHYTAAKNVNFGVGITASDYAEAGDVPASLAAIGFEDPDSGDYSLATGSPYHAAATDGTDVGVDMSKIPRSMTSLPQLQ